MCRETAQKDVIINIIVNILFFHRISNVFSFYTLIIFYIGVQSLTNIKVNPGQTTVFTCTVSGNPTPTRESVVLERFGGDTSGIEYRSESSNDTSRNVQFSVNQVAANELMRCVLRTSTEAFLEIQSKTFG